MAAANYGRPKPVDPLWYRPHCRLHIWCGCGHSLTSTVGAFAAHHRLSPGIKLYELIDRLRCSRCGAKPAAEVTLQR